MSDCWKSLLSTLLDAGAEATEIYMAEPAPGGGVWDFAFWNYDPDGCMVAFRCPPNRSVWRPVETPTYTGAAEPWERDESRHSKKPWHGDPDPK